MGITLEQREQESVLHLEESIDIAVAAEFRHMLREVLKGGKAVKIALDESAELDVTAVQLLWAAEREARALHLSYTLEGGVPEAISVTLKAAGFDKFPVPA